MVLANPMCDFGQLYVFTTHPWELAGWLATSRRSILKLITFYTAPYDGQVPVRICESNNTNQPC